jgi:hypothetical protein
VRLFEMTEAREAQVRADLVDQGIITPSTEQLRRFERPFLSEYAVRALKVRLIKAGVLVSGPGYYVKRRVLQ